MEEILNPIQGPNGAPPVGIGERLRTARKSLRLSEKEAAARLNLNTSLIDLMENENFHQGPPATFMRGYLRSYGRLLNFKDDEINLAINELNLSLPQNTLVSPATLQKKEEKSQLDRYLRWSSYFVISLLLGLVVVWWSSHPQYNEAETLSKQEVASIPVNLENATETSAAVVPPANTTIAAITPEAEAKPTPVTVQPITPAPIAAPILAIKNTTPTHEIVNDVDDTSGENVY